ncbi:Asx homology domain-containing protein [Mycena olivaceomarginata]|nr:Asx homology domain-containing protein [Mycena olivaceomarginata]
MADAPRRSNRKPKPTQREVIPAAEHVPAKRKAKDVDPDAHVQHFMLQNPKSRLTKMNISDLINANSWNMLSPDSQSRLAALLPPTAFSSFQPSIGSDHPAATDSMNVDFNVSGAVDPSLFTDSHFLAAAHTFQDHLFSDWLSDAHAEKVKKYEEGIRNGSLAAPWKDEVWERDNEDPITHSAPTRAGEAAELKLVDLAKSSVLRQGDILAYKRHFTNLGILVEKDVIIQKIDARTHSLTVLLEPGTMRDLPAQLLMPGPCDPSEPTRTMTITSPTQLESGLLDVYGVDRTKRPNGNAWKSFTVWRWAGDALETHLAENVRRGGREDHGTLFYLRACHYEDR